MIDFKVPLTDEQICNISDGYHTFDELYDHRIFLYLSLARFSNLPACWKPHYPGWPVLFIETPAGQISYHFKEQYLPLIDGHIFRDDDYIWDGHTSEDVVKRLKEWLNK